MNAERLVHVSYSNLWREPETTLSLVAPLIEGRPHVQPVTLRRVLRFPDLSEPRNQLTRQLTPKYDRIKFQKDLISRSSHVQIVALIPKYQNVSVWTGIATTIEEWGKLQNGWDGDTAPAPSPEGLREMRAFVDASSRHDLRGARAYISADGEFGLRWKVGSQKASLSFLPDGLCVAYVTRRHALPLQIEAPIQTALKDGRLLEAIGAFAA
jgi:hypothetical protein